ncbi:hypothetical protein BCR39DRAFT_558930 [Naematelia encephala]|uniref:Uncharacterized protein n=1 Tax=Naematelia encephala TaxID=71784 RepID=A0A1Y2B4P6_9TREE|nr:hypothetical protein BCR39DRAFT_558930 [Naematelia encephala]
MTTLRTTTHDEEIFNSLVKWSIRTAAAHVGPYAAGFLYTLKHEDHNGSSSHPSPSTTFVFLAGIEHENHLYLENYPFETLLVSATDFPTSTIRLGHTKIDSILKDEEVSALSTGVAHTSIDRSTDKTIILANWDEFNNDKKLIGIKWDSDVQQCFQNHTRLPPQFSTMLSEDMPGSSQLPRLDQYSRTGQTSSRTGIGGLYKTLKDVWIHRYRLKKHSNNQSDADSTNNTGPTENTVQTGNTL